MDFWAIVKRPSAFVPLIMSAAASAMVLAAVAVFGVDREADEGTAAHIFQLLLAAPLTVNGAVLAPEGTKVFGKVLDSRGGKVLGGSYIMFSFTDIQIGNDMVPIQTTEVGAEAGKGGAAKKVGAGALIGAAAGDAGVGAAIGGGLAILSSAGNHLGIPKGTKAEVQLKTDLKIGG